MFKKAVDTIYWLAPNLTPGWIYRGEYLEKPHHNALRYERIPARHIMLFDITTGAEMYFSPNNKAAIAASLGLECVPCLHRGPIHSMSQLLELLGTPSILGNTTVEGVVVKNYDVFTAEKKVAMGKLVSEQFKETNKVEWRKANPTQKDIVDRLIETYRTEPRWHKAVQHLRELGSLEGSPRDIGALMREVPEDILKECTEEIKDALFAHFWSQIRRGVTAGLPEWYKLELVKTIFPTPEESQSQMEE
jgi:hypothetical protein